RRRSSGAAFLFLSGRTIFFFAVATEIIFALAVESVSGAIRRISYDSRLSSPQVPDALNVDACHGEDAAKIRPTGNVNRLSLRRERITLSVERPESVALAIACG